MVSFLALFFVLVGIDIFLGIPIIYVLAIMNSDAIVILAVGALGILLPLFALMMEMNQRRIYPIRCDVSYTIGEKRENQTAICSEDRLGYVDRLDINGKKTGAKEWKLCGIGKPIINFKPDYIYEKRIWFGFKTAKYAQIYAVQTEKGEEFRPMKQDAKLGANTPVFDGDKGMLFHKIRQDIQARHKIDDWIKTYLPYIIIGGLVLLVAVFQFLTWLKMGDFINALDRTASNFATCSENYKIATNQTQSNTVKPGNIAGIPFGASSG